MNIRRLPGLLLAGCLLVSSCQQIAAVQPRAALNTDSANEAQTALEAGIARNQELATQAQEVPPAVMDQLMPPIPGNTLPAEVAEERFDISVNKVAAADFFRSLVSATHYNMVVHPDVKGEVSLDLKDVTVAEVMDIMRNVYGYDYQRSGRLYQVYPDALRTEIMHLDYLNVGRKGQSEMQVSASTISDSQNSGTNNGYSGGFGSGYVQTGAGNNSATNMVGTQVSTDSDANFWKELQTTLTAIVGDFRRDQRRGDATGGHRGDTCDAEFVAGRAYVSGARAIDVAASGHPRGEGHRSDAEVGL